MVRRLASVSATACSKVTDGRQNLLVLVLLKGCLKWTVTTCFFSIYGACGLLTLERREEEHLLCLLLTVRSLWNSYATSSSKYYVQITHVFVYHICMLPLGKPQEVHISQWGDTGEPSAATASCQCRTCIMHNKVSHLHCAQ